MVIEIGWKLMVLGLVASFWWGICVLAREGRRRP